MTGLAILKKLHWIDRRKLADFILHSQDLEGGGIADRPGDWVDVFHTNFGVAGEGLGPSLLGYKLPVFMSFSGRAFLLGGCHRMSLTSKRK